MKRRYQIAGHRAVQGFRRWATEENPKIQMILPLAEVVSLLQEGVGHLLREAGLALMQLVMEEEVRRLAGERHQQHAGRQAYRWGKEAGPGVPGWMGRKCRSAERVCATNRTPASRGWGATSCSSGARRWSGRCGTG